MTRSLTVSAPGKLVLFGEHAVVYGRGAIVTAMEQRVHVTIEPLDAPEIAFELPFGMDDRFVRAAVIETLSEWKLPQRDIRIRTTNAFSESFGFGSSSAVVGATIMALRDWFGRKESAQDLFMRAVSTIRHVQGIGSGVDAAAAIFGKTIYYKMDGPIVERIPLSSLPLVVGYSGQKADTPSILAEISAKMAAQQERVNRIYDAIDAIVTEVKPKLLEGDFERVGRLMDFNQEYLRDLGVSSEKLEALIAAAKKAGAWGAKLSGAGRGDSMVAVVPETRRRAVEDAITSAGGKVIHILPDADGIRRDA